MEQELEEVMNEIKKYNIQDSQTIKKAKLEMLKELLSNNSEIKEYYKLLKEYRYVDEIDELRYGSYIRWFNITDPEATLTLLRGGFIADITNKNGVNILCKNRNKFFTIKMDKSVIFQKNTSQEKLLIQILDHIN
uniref:Uncharacterized protein n=1 Tax=viral metagenome TaxID=1070528 RepID=A0A6C0D1G7_9ZZZZ